MRTCHLWFSTGQVIFNNIFKRSVLIAFKPFHESSRLKRTEKFLEIRESRFIRLYEAEPATAEEEYQQRLAELDFHAELARQSDNEILGFVCVLLLSLLREMTVCREIYSRPNPELRERGLHYQVQLLRAIKAGEAERARTIMRRHMEEAERYMLASAAMRGWAGRGQGDE